MQAAVSAPPDCRKDTSVYFREIALSGNRQMYISVGVGHLLRVRFNVRPESQVFRLHALARELCN